MAEIIEQQEEMWGMMKMFHVFNIHIDQTHPMVYLKRVNCM